jgi:hypothetical protein
LEDRRKLENNINMDVQEIGVEYVDWINLTEDRNQGAW